MVTHTLAAIGGAAAATIYWIFSRKKLLKLAAAKDEEIAKLRAKVKP